MVGERGFAFVPAAIAQSTDARKAEAHRLLQQGVQQYQTSQFREPLQSLEKALQIYREIKNRQGEAKSLGGLGNAYDFLGQYPKAILTFHGIFGWRLGVGCRVYLLSRERF